MRVDHLNQLFSALNGADVRYVVVGGLAVVAHGHARLTVDVDLVLQLMPENLQRASRVLTELGYRPAIPVDLELLGDAGKRERLALEKHMMVLSFRSEAHRWEPVDVFVREPFPFDEVHGRVIWTDLGGGVRVPIVPRDVLEGMKRAAGRPKDLDDLKELDAYRKFEEEQARYGR